MLNNPIIMGKELPALANPGTATDLLIGKQLIDQNGNVLTGTMPPLAEQTSGTATASDILSGKTAWVNGSKLTGSMTNRGAVSQTLSAGGSYTIPAGYHNGNGKVSASSLSSQTSGTATASDILSGKTAWVNGVKLTGTGSSTPSLKLKCASFRAFTSSFNAQPLSLNLTSHSSAADDTISQSSQILGYTYTTSATNGVETNSVTISCTELSKILIDSQYNLVISTDRNPGGNDGWEVSIVNGGTSTAFYNFDITINSSSNIYVKRKTTNIQFPQNSQIYMILYFI